MFCALDCEPVDGAISILTFMIFAETVRRDRDVGRGGGRLQDGQHAYEDNSLFEPELETVDFTCTSFDAGNVSNVGCMWQLEVDIENVVEPAKSVNWTPLITRCTGGMKEPMCPPFTDCVDSECTLCS